MNLIYKLDRISLFAKFEKQEKHKHYAKHLIVSDVPFMAVIEGERIKTKSIFIQSNVMHEIIHDCLDTMFVMLIDESSNLSDAIDEKYLKERSYFCNITVLEDKLINDLKNQDLKKADEVAVLEINGQRDKHKKIDSHIQDAVHYVESIDTIGEDCFSEMAKISCLSKSRFSHLFKENMNIDCKNFLLQKKFEKSWYLFMNKGYSITDAAIEAGFSSSSHIASSFKNHFGISISRFLKEQDVRKS